jgi:hypothetical protein
MRRVNVRHRNGSIRTGGVFTKGSHHDTTLQVLKALHPYMQDYTHPLTGTSFGGSLLAPSVQPKHINEVFKPVLLRAQNKNTITAEDAKQVLDTQEKILQANPPLRREIHAQSQYMPEKDLHEIKDTYEEMTNRQLYHHVLGMPDKDWVKIQEVAGRLVGKRPHPYLDHEDMPRILEHTKQRYNLGGSVVPYRPGITGGSLTPHLLDVSVCTKPLHAAQRLEFSREGGPYAHALKAALYATDIAPVGVKHPTTRNFFDTKEVSK